MIKRHRVRARAEGEREVWLQLLKSHNEPKNGKNLVTYDWEKETGDNATILCPPLLPSEIGQWWRIRKRGKEDLGRANLLQTSMAGRRIEWWVILTENGSAVPFAMFFPAYSSSCACASLCSLVMPARLEKWLLPRPNGPTLNVCQIHNHNNNNNENNYRNCDTNGDRCVILNTFFCPTRNSQAIIAYSWNRGF